MTVFYIGIKFVFEEGMGIAEIIITILTLLYFVWGFNLQFWKTNRKKINKKE